MDGASLQELIVDEGVTFSGGVPTIWTMYLAYLEQTGEDAGNLQAAGDRRLGGAAGDGGDLQDANTASRCCRSGA